MKLHPHFLFYPTLFLVCTLFACGQKSPPFSIALLPGSQAPANIVSPGQSRNRLFFIQPRGWEQALIAINFFSPSFIKPAPNLNEADQNHGDPAVTDPWTWSRIDEAHYDYTWPRRTDTDAELHGSLVNKGNCLLITGDLINHREDGVWRENLGLTLNFQKAHSFADPTHRNTFMFPRATGKATSMREIYLREHRSQPVLPQVCSFWIYQINQPRHLAKVWRMDQAGKCRIRIEGTQLLFVNNDTAANELRLIFGIFAKPEQSCHFSARITFEQASP